MSSLSTQKIHFLRIFCAVVVCCCVAQSVFGSKAAKLLASDPLEGASFGADVSISGTTLIVGAPGHNSKGTSTGAAYIYRWDGAAWLEEAILMASDGSVGDNFGRSVAISGDTVIVGAITDGPTGQINVGSAYIFQRSGSTWTEQVKLTSPQGVSGGFFGWSVDIDGDTALIGARLENVDAGFIQGAAHVFVRNGTVWTYQSRLVAPDGVSADQFGISVALSGSIALVGAYLDDDNGFNSGSAYVFFRDGSQWFFEQKLIATDGASGGGFGWSVDLDANSAIIGAPFASTISGTGSAYVFVRDVGGWAQETKLGVPNVVTTNQFGFSVSIDNNTALVGSFSVSDTLGVIVDSTVFVFARSGTIWAHETILVADDNAAGDKLGYSVALEGDVAVLGAKDDNDTEFNQGSVYVYERIFRVGWVYGGPDGPQPPPPPPPLPLPLPPDLSAPINQTLILNGDPADDAAFGSTVAIDSDTVVIGIPGAKATSSPGAPTTGKVEVYIRSATTWTLQGGLFPTDQVSDGSFGSAIDIQGDVLVVGDPMKRDVHVFTRSSGMWSLSQRIQPSLNDEAFGGALGIDGDVLVVGAWRSQTVHVYRHNASNWTLEFQITKENIVDPEIPLEQVVFTGFGFALGVSRNTLLVGCPGCGVTGPFGSSNFIPGAYFRYEFQDPAWIQTADVGGQNDIAAMGVDVAIDSGVSAVVDGGHNRVHPQIQNENGWSTLPFLTSPSPTPTEQFGSGISLDYAVLAIGAPGNDNNCLDGELCDAGAVFLYINSLSSWDLAATVHAPEFFPTELFGSDVAWDNNTLVVGAPGHDIPKNKNTPSSTNSGAVWIFEYQGEQCPADINGDTIVDGLDLLLLLGGWGNSGLSDINSDGTTDGADLFFVLGTWGACL